MPIDQYSKALRSNLTCRYSQMVMRVHLKGLSQGQMQKIHILLTQPSSIMMVSPKIIIITLKPIVLGILLKPMVIIGTLGRSLGTGTSIQSLPMGHTHVWPLPLTGRTTRVCMKMSQTQSTRLILRISLGPVSIA
jgi:hypothetical protein